MKARIIHNEQIPDSQGNALFGKGKKLNDPAHFTGDVYVREISGFDKPMLVDSVTFAPGCINAWHIHQAGQILLVTDGTGWYQEEGCDAVKLHAGDVVDIPGGVKHWHGAARDSWFPILLWKTGPRENQNGWKRLILQNTAN